MNKSPDSLKKIRLKDLNPSQSPFEKGRSTEGYYQ